MKQSAVLFAAFLVGVFGYFFGLLLMVPNGSDQAMVIAMAMLLAPFFGAASLLVALASINLAKQSATFALIVASLVGFASAPILKGFLGLSDERYLRAAERERIESNKRSLEMFWSEGFPRLEGFSSGAPYLAHDYAIASQKGTLPADETCEKIKAKLTPDWDEITLSDSCHFGRVKDAVAESISVSKGGSVPAEQDQTFVTFRKSTQTRLAYRQLDIIVRAFKKQNWNDLERLQTPLMLKAGGLRKVFQKYIPEESAYDDGKMWADYPGNTQWLAMRIRIDREATRSSSGIEISDSLPPGKVQVIVLTLRTEKGLWRVESANIMSTDEYNEKLRL